MRDVTINNLDDRSIGKLRRLIRDGRGDETPPRQPAPVRDQQGAEHLLFEIPAAGIDAFTGTTVDSADCVTYRILSDGTLQSVPGERTLHNLRRVDLQPGERVVGHRDAWGLFVAIDGGGIPCVDPQQTTIETWIPNAAHTRLLQVITTQFLELVAGCIRLASESLATGRWIQLCCEGSSGCPSTGSGSELLYADTCPGWMTSSETGGGGSFGPSLKGTFHEIYSFDPSVTTITDGGTVTFAATWGLREDVVEDSALTGSICCQEGDDASCGITFRVTGSGVALRLISSDSTLPGSCLRRGDVWTYEETYEVIFTGDCDVPRSIMAAIELGRPVTPVASCSTAPAQATIFFNASGTVTCPTDVPPPVGIPTPCPDSSGGSSSGGGSGSSGPSTSSGGGSGPSSPSLGGGL